MMMKHPISDNSITLLQRLASNAKQKVMKIWPYTFEWRGQQRSSHWQLKLK